MNYLKKNILLLVVFITGASILVVEIVATRILSPYYGSTIFTVSSVISVILAALSLGYYFGGRFADRHPNLKWFYGIIFLGGISIFLLQFLMLFLLPTLGYGLSLIYGPLVSSLLLFFLPSFLLGTLSPFAIKLQQETLSKKEGIGKVSGDVYFWSTCGSIFGSLLAGFFLIPHFGVNQIITSTAALLTFIGFIALLILKADRKTALRMILLSVTAISLAAFPSTFPKNKNILYERDGIYEKMVIYENMEDGRMVRFFQQDRSSSGAMFLNSNDLVYDYSKYYVLYKIFKPEARGALVIGGGVYSIPKALLADLPEAKVDVVEIEPSLFSLSQKFFRVSNDARLTTYIEDGRRFLHDSDKKYDLIFSDAIYTLLSIPSHLTTEEFLQIAKSKLTPDGILLINLPADLSTQGPSFFFSEAKTFISVFPNSYFFAVVSPKSKEMQNIIAVGYNSDKIMDFSQPEIKNSKNEIISNLNNRLIDMNQFDLTPFIKLTDNYSPVEYLTAQSITRALKIR